MSVLTANRPTGSNATDDYSRVKLTALSLQYVGDRLVAPGTMQFPYRQDDGVFVRRIENTCTYSVTGYVDSENRFGALIRTHYTAIVESSPTEADHWRLVSIQLQD